MGPPRLAGAPGGLGQAGGTREGDARAEHKAQHEDRAEGEGAEGSGHAKQVLRMVQVRWSVMQLC